MDLDKNELISSLPMYCAYISPPKILYRAETAIVNLELRLSGKNSSSLLELW